MNMELTLKEKIESALQTVQDPEIPVSILELGLVYELKIQDDVVWITMTLTAPACPVAGEIIQEVQQKVEAVEGVKAVHVTLTFDPPWSKDMMSEEARLELGFM